jgi:hypothetical protein
MVFAPWDDPIPLKRAWCLWELYCTVTTGSTFNIAMTVRSRRKFIKDILTNPTAAMNQMLGTINVERSECFKESDRLLHLLVDRILKTEQFGVFTITRLGREGHGDGIGD